jgi:hypothetical protein
MESTLRPGTRLGPYEIEALIGSGGMGHVYRAHDPRLQRKIAIKTLSGAAAADADRVRRFEAEARAAGTLDHPNLLVVFDIGREGDVSYIVSELLEGETLRERLQAQPSISERQTIEFAVQIARGLAAAHARGIVHRDLKPENLFLTRDRRLKILDFGVAKLTGPSDATDPTLVTQTLTGQGILVGTVGYMAPEQIRVEAIDQRADIFALGLVMHEMLSGVRPFRRATTPETLAAILNDDVPDLPPTVSPALDRIVRRCLEKRRDDRFHSAHDLALALDLTPTASSSSSSAAAAVAKPALVSRRSALFYAASALGLAASGLAGGVWLERSLRPAVTPSFRRLTFRRGLIRSARLAPDGQTILYGALWEGENCRVHSSRVDSAESQPLDLPNANVLAVSRSGELALALGAHQSGVITYGTLARVPMTGGAPRELAENVKFADWSPDGTELAIVRGLGAADRLEFPIGKVLVEPQAGGNTGLGFPRVSADGSRVAFVQYRNPVSLLGRVCIADRAGNVTEISPEYLNIHGLAWRGDEIWYTAADERPLFRGLYAVKPGGMPRVVTRVPGNTTLWDVMPGGQLLIAYTDDRAVVHAQLPGDVNDRDLSWLDASWVADLSNDGQTLLFTETGQGGGAGSSAYIRRTDGSAAVRLAPGFAMSLSADTRWVICGGNLPSPYLDVVPTGAGEVVRMPGKGLAFSAAAWLPDGERFVASALAPGQAPRLYLMRRGQDGPTALTPPGVRAFAVSPDGSAIATSGPAAAIRLYPIDGGATRDVPGTEGLRLLGWIADGLLVMRLNDASAPLGAVYRVDTTNGRQEMWADILPADPAGIMVLVSFSATPDGRARAYSWHRALSSLYVANIA